MGPDHPALDSVRYEVLPFPSALTEAGAVEQSLTLTVTSSPKHGVDHTVDFGARLRALGHRVVVHIAARDVESRAHAERLLERMADAAIHDVFLIGGDAPSPRGPYAAAGDLLPVLRASAHAPRSIGIGAYPEGHPLIDDATLLDALRRKARLADYMTTQLCFDQAALRAWLREIRSAGLTLPVFVGVPGPVDRRKLLEISVRIGVGASVRFVRKQHGLRGLLGRGHDAGAQLRAALPQLRDEVSGIAGTHVYTFNRLVAATELAEAGPPSPLPLTGAQQR
jgi:methylenetetrahydrofolate reductase (NADPH)